ncbi:TetR/AcrR family transcriptional regulator [Fodinicola acaciae]|uniref:TetR/AcrR family transcriptional regulator n=1 Tax=Fodinicola acaciae TaxID=2681555 RepID=UPI0013D1AF11|nr:TetR family transcriptional regulator C-terminal domain-containing protein [Fodinicola acaciae]
MPRPNVEAERRKQILEAACAVIAKAGLQQLRVSDVAAEAGVSSGTIHYYFDSKKDLVAAAFEYNFAASVRRRRWLRESTVDPLRRLHDIVESYLPTTRKSLQAWRVWAELWAEGARDPALQKVNDELYGQWREVVRDAIEAAQHTGVARPGDPTRLANMLVAMMDGLAVQVLLRSKNMQVATMRATCRAFVDDHLALH